MAPTDRVSAVYLKSLTIKGFKSFADPATLHFEPGITVVVGPNGSGKSNVVDAVAWVLGAQGPRTVRSSKMEDVIFAGSADRPALGRAEVSLTIDNRAGRLPGGLAEITITRTLFRNGDSEYALNGQACRLLDVQELLSDSGVGRQQHVIVSQGQLDQILQARPEDRRTVIEEAAGVLKHRRRRERAERRLVATEENLERLGDVVREVRRQMRPLERQATATRAHEALSAERRALRLYLAGAELADLDRRVDDAAAERDRLAEEERILDQQLADVDQALQRATAELAGDDGEEQVQAALTQVQEVVERARRLGAVLAERRRSLARALDESAETDVVATLEAESARLADELRRTDDEAAALGPMAAEVEAAEAELRDGDVEVVDDDQVARLRSAGAAWARARAEVEPLRRSVERERAAVARLAERLAAAEGRRLEAAAEHAQVVGDLAAIEAEVPAAEQRSADAAMRAAALASEAEQADADAQQAQAARHRAEARADALARAVEETRGAAGLGAVTELTGVIGLVGDVVEVDAGWRIAFEAAAGPALAALAVDSVEAARAALQRLRDADAPGVVLVAGVPLHVAGPPEAATGVLGAAGSPGAAELGASVEPLRPHVRGTSSAVDRLLDQLLGAAVRVAGDWRDALDVAVAHPGVVAVTDDGGRFGPGGWRLRADSVVTAAAVEEARQAAEAAALRAADADAQRQRAREAARIGAEEAQAARLAAARATDRRQGLAATMARLDRQLAVADEELAELRRQQAEGAERLARDEAALTNLEATLPAVAEAAERAEAELRAITEHRRRIEARRAAVADRRRQLEVREAGLAERRAVLVDRLADVERRLAGHVAERERAAVRRRGLQAEAATVDRLADVVQAVADRADVLRRAALERRDAERQRRRHGGTRLHELRQHQQQLQHRADRTRQRMATLEVERAEAQVRRDGVVETLARELGCAVDDAVGASCPPLPEGVEPADRLAAVEAELASLGPVNPLALAELAELEERSSLLNQQVADVKDARRELQTVIKAVDDEVARLFVDAYTDVSAHFQNLVGTLFPGGTGRLSLTDPTDPLHTGVEVEARPAGKNVRKLTLLSGGERSLVALAFLFAVFRSRPSPFYLMDEVEAALDDVNLHRFLDLLHEFRGEAQLIVVSHQKRTMEAADALYGVTMQAGGSSKVVSQKVRRDLDGASATRGAVAARAEAGVDGSGGAGGATVDGAGGAGGVTVDGAGGAGGVTVDGAGGAAARDR